MKEICEWVWCGNVGFEDTFGPQNKVMRQE